MPDSAASNPDQSLAALLDGTLWAEFCDALKAAGEQVLAADIPADDLTRAEGYRYLTRLLRLGLEKRIEFGDPDFPQFYSLSHETAKIGNDNPDNLYLNCAIDVGREYRITGNRGSVAYLSIETKAGSFAGGGEMAPTGHVDVDDLAVAASGDFELSVSAREQPGNWLPMSPETDSILVRQTFRERGAERPARLQIECLDSRGTARLDPAGFAKELAQVAPFVTGTAGLFRQWMQNFAGHTNQLPPNDQQMCLRSGGDPAIYYHNSRWRLASDEALLIEFTPPRVCRAWNFQLSNHWMESLDYRYHRICINNHGAQTQADGSVRIVVSHHATAKSAGGSPGHFPNWLSTAGHSNGAMLLRYVAAENYPPVHTQLLPLEELLHAAPGGGGLSQSHFDPDAVVAAARAMDGLRDFGDDSYRQPLQKLLWSLEHEARLNETGRQVLRQRMVDILATRLRVQYYLQRFPEIRDEAITAPLFIVGLPRTGTTLLHRTIAADHRMYAPLWYEVRYPSPAPDWDFTAAGDARIRSAQAEMAAMLAANPDLLAIHPMDALGPDEDIMLLEQSFYSFNTQAYANIPSFDAWIESQDHTPGYEYFRCLLQFLQWQKKRSGQEGERWTLKAPHHLHYMDLVFRVFPDAKVVQSHRDPLETLPSLTSLIAGVWTIYSDSADPFAVGRQWSRKFARGMGHTMAVREQVGDGKFLDLWFEDTVSQPLTEIQKVYDFLGMDLTPEARLEMARWQDFNRREQRPSHGYTLAQYGFTEEGLKRQFSAYRERFMRQ